MLHALSDRRFLISAWPWRAWAFLVSTVPVGIAAGIAVGLLGLPWLVVADRVLNGEQLTLSGLLLVPVGLVLLGTLGPLVAAPLADVERVRLRLVDARPLRYSRGGYTDAATWRALGYVLLLVTAGPVVYGGLLLIVLVDVVWIIAPAVVADGTVSLGIGTAATTREAVPYAVAGLVLLPGVPYLAGLVAGLHGAVARALLGTPETEGLRTELGEVARSRARLVDAFEAERRRIERDLHDGAQQRLVGLTLQLGLARVQLADGSPESAAVADAHEQAKGLMVELRELIHGIHPQVLADLGLPEALRDLADRAPIPVSVRAELTDRPAAHLESTAYFIVAEALTNVAKHSGASSGQVTAERSGDTLVVEVVDEGGGGADPSRGTGLTGLADRVAVVGGRILLSSPDGGPTRLRVELPWSDR
ncbi:sensor histidine kinase [Cryptosporangium aurantiacum]|uniref:sensor histidine kinase n=1 Tax=Cryptosporangium aurantiacum TaxID=134849 RepID=UPI000934C14B|nr:histidine kinase [Cryptosporangium aurantiacum]